MGTIKSVKRPCLFAIVMMALWPALLNAAVECEGWGSIRGIRMDGQLMAVRTDIRVPLRGWGQLAQTGPGMAQDIEFTPEEGRRVYRGKLSFASGQSLTYRQAIEEGGVGHIARVNVEVTANDDLDVEGVFVCVSVPVAEYKAGQVELVDSDTSSVQRLPVEPMMQDNHILSGQASGLRVTASDRSLEFRSGSGRYPISVQDDRKWKTNAYTVMVHAHSGRLAKGQTVQASYSLTLSGTVDHAPAKLTLDASKSLYTFQGFGGNFVFRPDSPVTRYNLDHLRVSWARVWMPLHLWEPQNDNGSPADTSWTKLEANDQPGTELHQSLQMAADLQKRSIPCVISIWSMPRWLLANPWNDPFEQGRQIDPAKWDEVCESVGSYLLYAKRKYKVEPELFSFNESDGGVTVKLTPDEHRQAIRRLGQHFRKLGLKTKMLLGDIADSRKTAEYITTTLNDPQAMRYVGAIAFHAYGADMVGDCTEVVTAAKRAGVPLLVTEVGVDGNAFHYPAVVREAWYAIDEAAVYQELLLHAAPSAILEWEYSDDMPIVDCQGTVLKPTKRFWQLKQLSDLTPSNANVLATSSDSPTVLFTAFTDAAKHSYTLHIVNTGSSRPLTITGVPEGLQSLRTYLTDQSHNMQEAPPTAVSGGRISIYVPARTLLTMTSLAPSGLQASRPGTVASSESAPQPRRPAVIASWDRDMEGWSVDEEPNTREPRAEYARIDPANRRMVLKMKDGCRWAIRRQDTSLVSAIAGRKLALDVTATPQSAQQWMQLTVALVADGVEARPLPMQTVLLNGKKQTLTFDLGSVKLPDHPSYFILWIVTNTQQGSTPGEIYLDELRAE